MAWEPGEVRFFEKSVAPTTGDDENDGFRVSDVWINLTTDIAYRCVDSSVGAAVWNAGAGIGYVLKSLFDANSILKADSDNVPVKLSVAEQKLVGRITGGVISALTPAQARTLINVEDGANVGVLTAEAIMWAIVFGG